MFDPPSVTRNSAGAPCSCTTCLVGRASLWQDKKELLDKWVFSSTDNKAPPATQEPAVSKQCLICMSYVGKGLSHICTKGTFDKNIVDLVRQSSEGTLNRIMQTSIKTKFKQSAVNIRGGQLKLPRIGSSGTSGLLVTVGTKQSHYVPPRKFSHSDLMNLQVTFNLSDKVTFGLAQAQRVVHGRKSVEFCLKAALFEGNHKLDHFFHS